MVKAIIFDLWETLGTKNIGVSKSLQNQFSIEKTVDFIHLYEKSVQLEKWKSEQDMARNFLKEFKIEQNQENIDYVVNLFRKGIEKATMFSEIKDLLLGLKENYKLGLISNTTIFESVVLDKWEIKDIFDTVSFSWEFGMKKPAKEIFDITLRNLEVNPNEAVFIDDGQANVKIAVEYGLRGIVFVSVGQLQNDLKSLNIKI